MSLSVFVLIVAALGFGGTVGLGAALAMFDIEGPMKDFLVLNFIGASHTLALALIGGLWLIK
jgi:hypothetical protein